MESQNADYYKRMDALNIIASVFDIDKGEVERNLKNLTSHYFREKNKLEQLHKSGAGIDDVQEPKWFAYKALNFLRDKNKPLPTVNSENDMDSQKSQQDNVTATSSRKRRCGTDGDSDIAEALQHADWCDRCLNSRMGNLEESLATSVNPKLLTSL
ncbi:unnamed protein product [Acanthoscelides obtectus]|uniref:MADF domain-containing protein n=1 Tax=Acanthoscelides obtectus TaxID=200917 RepID=A0A9P0LCD5_ACAOB|nr:unnamed protein product [Acanthoscelides obtectus]CAK1632939.1 hypothetical protein AOBTE_LOCUS7834 [Acanthoscelides obtectus]